MRPVGVPANPTPLRVAIAPGVNPGKWTRAWSERRETPIEVTAVADGDQRSALVDGRVDVAFVRLPIDPDGLSVIRLYEEVTVVVVSSEHPIALFDAVTTADLVAETTRSEPVEDAIDLVVAGAGILVLPHSIARQHSRRDLAMRPVTDAPATQIAIAWLSDSTTEDIEEFVGIVRGRTAASSRGATPSNGSEPSVRTQPERRAGRKPSADRRKGRRPR